MVAIGRNDRCSCGSGKKWKKCCARRVDDRVATYTEADRVAACRRLMAELDRKDRVSVLRLGHTIFWGDRLDSLSDEQRAELLESEMAHVNETCFLAYDFDLDREHTLVDETLDRHRRSMTLGERHYLELARRSHLCPYEVTEIVRDRGVRLSNLWWPQTLWVDEVKGTHALARWDVLGARVLESPSKRWMFVADLYPFPARHKDEVLREFRRRHRRLSKDSPLASALPFFRRAGFLFNHLWIDLVFDPLPPRVVTPEGDDVVPTTVRFRVVHSELLLRALAFGDDFHRCAESQWNWTERTEQGERSLGDLTIEDGELVIGTLAPGIARRARRRLELLAGDAIEYVEQTSQPALVKGPRSTRKLVVYSTLIDSVDSDADRRQIEAQLLDQHMRAWPDTPVPALGGLTPRQASGQPRRRARLVQLVKEIQNTQAHAVLADKQVCDTDWLWSELGLELPIAREVGAAREGASP